MIDLPEDDDFLPPTPEESAYLTRQQHPYAKLSVTLRESKKSATAKSTVASPSKKGTSKADFVAECRRIFGQYMPDLEKGRLRPHHKAFISRNQDQSPLLRETILNFLRKYDLSSISGLNPQFNRERDELTEAKLRKLELAAKEAQ